MARLLLVALAAIALATSSRAASDLELQLDVTAFNLGAMAGFLRAPGSPPPKKGDPVLVPLVTKGVPNQMLLALTTLAPLPVAFNGVLLEKADFRWSSKSKRKYTLSVERLKHKPYMAMGFDPDKIMSKVNFTVGSDGKKLMPMAGNVPAGMMNYTANKFAVHLTCLASGKVRLRLILQTFDAKGAKDKEIKFEFDKTCGLSVPMPSFCAGVTGVSLLNPTGTTVKLSQKTLAKKVKILNYNIAGAAGVDRTLLVKKALEVTKMIKKEGYDVALLQEVWQDSERQALDADFKKIGLNFTIPYDGVGGQSGLFIASRFPIVKCGFHEYKNKSGIEAAINKGVMSAVLDLGKGELLGVYDTHVSAFGGNKDQVAQDGEMNEFVERFSAATLKQFGVQKPRLAALGAGDMNQSPTRRGGYKSMMAALGMPRDIWVEKNKGKYGGTKSSSGGNVEGGGNGNGNGGGNVWVAWSKGAEAKQLAKTQIICPPNKTVTYRGWSRGGMTNETMVCPVSGALDSTRGGSLLDYMFAWDRAGKTVLTPLDVASANVRSWESKDYNWIQISMDNLKGVYMTRMSDHMARDATVSLRPPPPPLPPPGPAASSGTAAAGVAAWAAAAAALAVFLR